MSSQQANKKISVSADPPRLLGTAARRAAFVIGLISIVVFFLVAGEDWLTIVNYTLIAAIAALALNVLSGYTGQVSLGLAFFMAIGAYTAAVLGGTPPTSPLDPIGLNLSSALSRSTSKTCSSVLYSLPASSISCCYSSSLA